MSGRGHWTCRTACILAIASALACRDSSIVGTLGCEGDADYHAGEVAPGAEVSHQFTLRNNSSEPITIDRLYRPCGCTSATISTAQLEPGGQCTLSATLQVSGTYGRRGTVTVIWHGTQGERHLECAITAVVKRDAVLSSSIGRVQFYETTDDARENQVQEVALRLVAKRESIERPTIEVPAWVTYGLEDAKTVDQGFGYVKSEFALRLQCTAGVPRLAQPATIVVRAPGASALRIPLNVQPRSDFDVSPAAVLLRPSGDMCLGSVRLKRRMPGKVTIAEIKSPPFLTCELREVMDGYEITVSASRAGLRADVPTSCSVTFLLQGGAQSSLQIDVAWFGE